MANSKNIKGITIEIGGNTTKLAKALENVNTKTKDLNSELKGLDSLLKLDPSNVVLLKQKQELLNKSLSNTKEKLKTLKESQEQVQKQFNGYKEAEPTLLKIKDKIEKTTKQLEKLEKKQQSIKEAFDAGKISKDAYDNINVSVDKCKNNLDRLIEQQKKLSEGTVNYEQYRDFQREIEATTIKMTNLKNVTSGFSKAGNSIEQFGNKVISISSTIDKVGNKFTAGLTLPIASFGMYAAKSAIDFETAFTGVRKTVDATEKEYEEFNRGIIEMSKTLPASASEISAVAEAAGQLGIQNDSLLSFTKTMINLGEATNLTSNDAATQLARFANITQMSQKDFDKLGSTIVALGNNFATTESEIVSMGLRLAGAGKQVGMSEAQIMSFATALSSVGIEAEAGGSAFSKVMLNIESDIATNSKLIEKWAEVSGLSVKEFTSLWENDASGALSKFINGLSGLEAKGENATIVLEELGLSEIRVRDSLLRASNASNVFNEALELGSKSWKENVALTEEANKRYETTESQMAIAKNNINSLAISLGKELLPHVNNLLKYLNKLADRFADMSEEEQEALLKNLALIASIGPATKTIGAFGKVVGTTSKGIGTFTKAVGLMKNGIGDATGSAATLAKGMKALASPTGLAVASVAALTTGLYALSKYEGEEAKKLSELNKNIDEQVKARKELMETRQQEVEYSLREIDNTESLYNELKQLVDVNGKVKEGYQNRANFILGELNNALGTEYQQIDGVISKYDELTSNIGLLIAKKRVEIILENQRKNYEDAIKKEVDASKSLAEAKEANAKAQSKVNELEEKRQQLRSKYSTDREFELSSDYRSLINELAVANVAFENTSKTLKEADKNHKEISNTIELYEVNAIRAQSDSLEEQNKIIDSNTRYTTENGKTKENAIKNTIEAQTIEIEKINENYKKKIKLADETEKTVLENTRISKQQLLNETIASLKEQTSAIGENSPGVINAWKSLQMLSTEQYQAALAKLPEDTRNAVVQMTGVTYDETIGIASAWGNMSMTSKDEFNKEIASLPEDTRKKIEQIAQSVEENGGTVTKKTKKLADDVMKELEKEGQAQVLGVYLTRGFASGINDASAVSQLQSNARAIGTIALTTLQKRLDEHSPSRISRGFGKNYTKGFALGILDEEDAAIKSVEDMTQKVLEATNITSKLNSINGINTELNQRITDATKTIFTTPNIQFNVQKLDQQNLELAFNYINKKFGSQY